MHNCQHMSTVKGEAKLYVIYDRVNPSKLQLLRSVCAQATHSDGEAYNRPKAMQCKFLNV
jgi:hypothetical protein